MSKDFTNLESLKKYVQGEIMDIMENQLAQRIKQTMSEAVDDSVYNAISPPVMYQRRSYNFGLGDVRTMESGLVSDGDEMTLTVTSQATLNNRYGLNRSGKSLQEIVISGEGYMYPGEHQQPRNFYETTRRKLFESDTIRKTLREELRRKGIKTD